MKRIKLLLIVISSAALCACGLGDTPNPIISDPAPSSVVQDMPSSGTPADSPGPIEPLDDSQPPREGMTRSRLTNEWVEETVAATRPIAVIIPNEQNAMPQYNISKASVVYEANVEGRMSRMMAIFEDWQDLTKIGNVRSLRTYYAYWAFEWDAFLVHYGGPYYVNDLLAQPDTQTVNGNQASDSAAFFRSGDRPAPHNGYATGAGLTSVINRKGYSLTYRDLADQEHFIFASKALPNTLSQYGENADTAVYIDMSGCYPLTRCYFQYNGEEGLYYRCQYLSGGQDGPHTDAATDEQLSFKNIIVQYVKYENLGNGYLAMQCIDAGGSGWYFTNGKGIPVSWEKQNDYGATRYYDDSHQEITLNTGKTMICIVCEGDDFTYR